MAVSIIPTSASCYFSVSRDGEFNQFLVYDYYDPAGYYARLLHKPRKCKTEIRTLCLNMQSFLDQEEVKVNGVRVYPKVLTAYIGHRGFMDSPYVAWVIAFKGKLRKGLNVFENTTEQEKAEYDFEIVWQFPVRSSITNVKISTESQVVGKNTLIVWARKGELVGGYERIEFMLY
ncbi:MAG: hypothetical protein N3F04_06060 [Candidatus Nezhaarchaeota archaeon]|nr:hypothetical protein [Candidatus Nezhaarchaeota archaeon]